MILLTSLLSMRLRSLATEALYSILYAKALSQLGAGDDGIVLIPKPLQRNLVVRILGQIGLQCLTDQKGLRPLGALCEIFQGPCDLFRESHLNRNGHGYLL